MKAWRHRSRLFIGLWVITGLVVLGINGYVLMSLLDEPLAGYSHGVRQADRGFRQYRQLIRDEADKIYTGMELLVQRFSASVAKIDPSAPVDQKEASAPVEKKIKQPAFATVKLPVLTGIVTSQSSSGRIHQMAILGSGVYSEGQTLKDFIIREISADGVLLAKGKKTWFLKRPDIAYSLSQH